MCFSLTSSLVEIREQRGVGTKAAGNEQASEQAREETMTSTTEEDEEVAKGKTGGGGIARGVQLTSNRTLHRDARS